MLTETRKEQFIYSSFRFLSIVFFTILFTITIQKVKITTLQIPHLWNAKDNLTSTTTTTTTTTTARSLVTERNKHILPFTDSTYIHHSTTLATNIRRNKTLETTIQCIGSLYNQSCLYTNLYYVNSAFMILTVKGRHLPPFSVRTDAFILSPRTPNKREFDSYANLEKFVRTVTNPTIIPSVNLHFGQPWHFNIAHALFDGLYPAHIALIRFPPRHLQSFRVLFDVGECNDCWSEDVYSRFGGLGILKHSVLNEMSKDRWFMFDELVMGSGTLCQRCTQPNLQLPGGVDLDASRLFRDRIYHQHGLMQPIVRQKSSSEGRTSRDLLLAYIIDNKRYTSNDRKQINDAINEINNYTDSILKKTTNNITKLEWPLIHISYLYYNLVKGQNLSSIQIKATAIDSRSLTYELIDNKFIPQLKILHQMDIHITGPGTGQMYQTFLPDGSITVNLGDVTLGGSENIEQAFTAYQEQYLTSGAPYIKGLYYPINERPKGINKGEVIKLIRQAAQLILQGFSLPVNPRENLAADGQVFVEMCEKDKEFCSLVTLRLPDRDFACLEIWVEDFVHEYRQWNVNGFVDRGRNVSCPFNHSLVHELREKYGIKHKN